MQGKRLISSVTGVLLLFAVCFLFVGCPNEPSTDYRGLAMDVTKMVYAVDFSTQKPPTVRINYKASDGSEKTASFQLDGYDAASKTGLKVVTAKDKEKWDADMKNGDTDAPDMRDYKEIRQAAKQSKVVFLSALDLKNGSFDEIIENQSKITDEIRAALEALGFKEQEDTAVTS